MSTTTKGSSVLVRLANQNYSQGGKRRLLPRLESRVSDALFYEEKQTKKH